MKRHSKKDPFHQRESEKYSKPIPSREFILDILENSQGPMTHRELCGVLSLEDDEQIEALRRRLRAMERDAQVVINRRNAYGPLDKMNLVKGKVSGHPEGYGFVITDKTEPDVFLSSRQMQRVMDGDLVLVRIIGSDRRGRKEGAIVEVVERGLSKVVGRYFTESGAHFVRPDNPRISQDILVSADGVMHPEDGQVVVIELTTYPGRNQLPAGQIVQILGDHLSPGMEIDVAIHNYGIPYEWSAAVDQQVAKISDTVQEADKTHRKDYRNKHFITIDGEDARDFDDAVYCEASKGGGWRLFVAIADVSHYVPVGSALDKEAFQRGTSVYFPQQVIPMLPEKLSNGLCSLKPNEDRLSLVCEMRFSAAGELTGFWFSEGVIHSHARLTYTQVAQMLAQQGDKESQVRARFANVCPDVDALYRLYQLLRSKRDQRGAIDFETVATRILFDEQRKIEQIIPEERTEAHKLIEECMLAANVCAATLLGKSDLPALYRVHQGPSEEKLKTLRSFLTELGLSLPGGDDPSPADYQRVIEGIKGRVDANVIQTMMLRSMSQAVYQPENDGHFGLHYDAYTHFTSPIRRYPDLLTHRAIRHLVRSKRRIAHLRRIEGVKPLDKKTIYPYDAHGIDEAGVQSSVAERRADEATRDVDNWLKCEFMLEHVGDEFDGVVAAVTGFGLFVQLKNIYIEGLVHITSLPKDYYQHEASHQRLVGERTGRQYALGDDLKVRVVSVNLEERKIDLELAEGDALRKPASRRPARRKSGGRKRSPQKADDRSGGDKPGTPIKRPARNKPETKSTVAKKAKKKIKKKSEPGKGKKNRKPTTGKKKQGKKA